VKEIVELRGSLRHHSLGSPHRWDPNRQEDFEPEARFLALLANNVAFPKTTGRLWEPERLEQFGRLAEEMNMNIEVTVSLTIKEGGHVRDVLIGMKFPQPQPDSQLATAVITKSIETLNESSPGAELFAVRAWVGPRRTELLRYDLGPSIAR
jgi:hypothetical protein